jgi:phosphate transport system substrate-binding protein
MTLKKERVKKPIEIKKAVTIIVAVAVICALAIGVYAYVNSTSLLQSQQSAVQLNGAGASFPYPLISKWAYEYAKNHQVQINYQPIGSGGGINSITQKIVDFGASDAPMTDAQMSTAPGIIHIPITLGAAVVGYNLPGISSGLKMTPEIIAGIFLGKITKWNDPQIVALNPTTTLPDKDILVVHRSDGSGTTYMFTDWLSKTNSTWANNVGKGTSVNWPIGLGAKGNEGVGGVIAGTKYTIGYIGFEWAKAQNISYAFIKNQAGNFIEPTPETISNAASDFSTSIPTDLRISIVNAPGSNSYPIASFSYILVYKDQTDKAKGQALANFLWWAIHDGQSFSQQLYYAPLPQQIVTLNEGQIKSMNYKGEVFVS